MKNISLTDDDIKNIQIIIEYLLDSEKLHYEENIVNNFENIDSSSLLNKEVYSRAEINHIYAITRRLKDAIDLNF